MEAKKHEDSIVSEINFNFMNISSLALIAVGLPLTGLTVCLVTSYLFQYDDVHETSCRVWNVIPSISAVTGIAPQTYLWRWCIALHVGPRIVFAHLYKNYLRSRNEVVFKSNSKFRKFLLSSSYWLNIIEISALCGLTFTSNRENYPVHEKFFITFMVCSLLYMLLMVYLFKSLHPSLPKSLIVSYRIKTWLFVASITSTIVLIFFYLKHKLYCHDMAFSWFAFSEYVIAVCNVAFHSTVALDFKQQRLVVSS